MRIKTFRGMIPKLDDRNLSDNYADYAENCCLVSGGIDPFKDCVFTQHVINPYGDRPPQVKSLHYSAGVWIGFKSITYVAPDVLEMAGVDSFLYVTDGALWRSSGAFATDGKGPVRLGIETPCKAPEAAPVDGACTWDEYALDGCWDELFPPRYDCGDNQNPPLAVAFLFTYVTACEEESAPSPPTELIMIQRNQGVALADTSTPPTNAVTRRWYVLVAGSESNSGWFLFAETEIATPAVVYCPAAYNHQDLLITGEWAPPPKCIEGVAVVGQNTTLVWEQRNIWLSEANQPHTYPEKYRLTVDYPIVAILPVEEVPSVEGEYFAVVLTTGCVYLLRGELPELVTVVRIPRETPAYRTSKAAVYGGAVVFPSVDGLYAVIGGRVTNLTSGYFSAETWQRENPQEMQIGYWNNHLIIGRGTRKALVLPWPRQDNPYPDNLVYLSYFVDAVFFRDDIPLHFISTGTTAVYKAFASPECLVATWRSGNVVQVGRWHPTAAKIVAAAKPLTEKAKLYMDKAFQQYGHLPLSVPEAEAFVRCNSEAGNLLEILTSCAVTFTLLAEEDPIFSRPVYSYWPFRLPRRRRVVNWGFEVSTKVRIVEVHVQTSMEDLTQEGGHA